jgi:hypothetical protein
MLIDNKFIFINLPRCASYAFHISCLRNNFDIEFFKSPKLSEVDLKNLKEMDNDKLIATLPHFHERIVYLQEKFGKNYPTIAIKRDNYETFISLYKQLIRMLLLNGEPEVSEKLQNYTVDDILFFNKEMVLGSDYSRENLINEFIEKLNINLKNDVITNPLFLKEFIRTLLSPKSWFHNNDPDIIWFDIDKIYELENWVSKITNTKFKLEKINESNHVDCKLILNEKFKEKYDLIYSEHNNFKKNKSII